AGFVLQVVEPHLNGPAGEVPMVAWDARADRPFVVCGQGTMPTAATPAAFRDLGLDLVPGTGLLPACVPGQFGARMLFLCDYGPPHPRYVSQYAVGYAADGFPVVPKITSTVETVADVFREHWPTSAKLWLAGGSPPRPGTVFRNPALAATYERILTEAEAAGADREAQIEAAREAFYGGFVAEALVDFASKEVMDVSGRPHAGLLTRDDLASWRATVEEPLAFD